MIILCINSTFGLLISAQTKLFRVTLCFTKFRAGARTYPLLAAGCASATLIYILKLYSNKVIYIQKYQNKNKYIMSSSQNRFIPYVSKVFQTDFHDQKLDLLLRSSQNPVLVSIIRIFRIDFIIRGLIGH
jgi:hypothetical protein